MLREIVNFTKSLSEESFKYNLEPSEGIHLRVWLDQNHQLAKYQKYFHKKGEDAPELRACLDKEYHTKWIAANKPFDSKKKIHSCSPFTVAFKVQSLGIVSERFDNYFDTALTYCGTDEQKDWNEIFRRFCKTQLLELLKKVMKEIKDERIDDKRFKFKDSHYIYVYLENVPLEDYKQTHQNYLAIKAFNSDPKLGDEFDGDVYGIPYYLNGYNSKKPYLHHKTATFDINNRVTGDDTVKLFRFSQMVGKQLPNPLPIFIDRKELNNTVIRIFNRDQSRIGYREIIEELFGNKVQDLGNYYLLNFQRGDLVDFDFVSSFRYKLDHSIRIDDLFGINSKLNNQQIGDVFNFEQKIVSKIFNNSLVEIFKEGYNVNYFLSIEDRSNRKEIQRLKERTGTNLFNCILKYRKAFYDYIYKSKRETLHGKPAIFHAIMRTGILDDIAHDEDYNKSFTIKEKLNIWFNLYHYFNSNLNEGGGQQMANQIKFLNQRMHNLVDNEDTHIENDNEFAYATGQAIYFLLSLSKTSQKTHALLEPFLQKSDLTQLNASIIRIFNQYKHEVKFGQRSFNKLMSEILGHKTDRNIKELLPFMLAGYFANNVIYRSRKAKTEETSEIS